MNGIRPFSSEKIRPPRDFVGTGPVTKLPLDLEIGCGSGWHAIRYARENPDRFLVAIERTHNRFASFERRRRMHLQKGVELDNLLAVHADAVPWVTHALMPRSVERIFLLYPNPYPKNSDRGKRWYAMPFMGKLLEVLKRGGEIRLATNEEYYFDEAGRYMTGMWGLEETGAIRFSEREPRTHFEKKYLARGEICYERSWKKP